jgi:hypothetical protein
MKQSGNHFATVVAEEQKVLCHSEARRGRKEDSLKSSKRYVSILAVLFAISISLVSISGCSQNAVAPVQNDLNQPKLDWLNQFFTPGGAQRGSTPLDSCAVVYDTLIVKWVGYTGGTFMTKTGSEVINFRVPLSALYDWTQLSLHVTKYQAPFGSFWLLDCGPEGTVFAHALQVTPNAEVTRHNLSVLFYFNPTTGQWEVQDVARTGNPLSIDHFSKYGIS